MGHTLPPFSYQFKAEQAIFAEMRKALQLRDDMFLFDDLWNKAEFHTSAADKARYPLPIASILLTMNLEQEKALFELEGKSLMNCERIQQLEDKIKDGKAENILLKGEIESLRWEIEELKSDLRAEMLELLYPDYVAST